MPKALVIDTDEQHAKDHTERTAEADGIYAEERDFPWSAPS